MPNEILPILIVRVEWQICVLQVTHQSFASSHQNCLLVRFSIHNVAGISKSKRISQRNGCSNTTSQTNWVILVEQRNRPLMGRQICKFKTNTSVLWLCVYSYSPIHNSVHAAFSVYTKLEYILVIDSESYRALTSPAHIG